MNEGPRGLDLLALVHREPGITRAEAARRLGIGSGLATEVTARLVTSALLEEAPSPPTGARGRPSTVLNAHPKGPLALCMAVDHEAWRVGVIELGCRIVDVRTGAHDRALAPTLAAITRAAASLRRTHGARIVASAVSVPGTVSGDVLLQAPGLGWSHASLAGLNPRGSRRPFRAGNDATYAAVAEARRGVGAGHRSLLHLYFDAGLGGAIVESGSAVLGATGVAGEFGHLPFGAPDGRCDCGAYGCWNLSINAAAFAAHLGRRAPRAEATFIRGVLAAARRGEPAAAGAVNQVAAAVGRGAAGLVNALDPSLVTFGGYGRDLLDLARPDMERAYRDGLMRFRRDSAPVLAAAALGSDAPMIGAGEDCFDQFLASGELAAWNLRAVG